LKKVLVVAASLLIVSNVMMIARLEARNRVLGRIKFHAANKAAANSGVWIDGQYVGFLKELKGSRKLLLLPGTHRIQVQQSGYVGFSRKIVVEPGETEIVKVALHKDTAIDHSKNNALLKISGRPKRAAIFIDHQFVGRIEQFDGLGHGMLLTPGKHHIEVSMPGYEPFVTNIDLAPHQKLKLKTKLPRNGAPSKG
jgi:PEGA domain